MPRPNRARSVFAERNLAQRVQIEREQRSWTYEGLAARMKARGCTIAPSALYKIEKGDPPRRITVDELVALSQVFEMPMTQLVADPKLLLPGRAADLMEKITLNLITADVAREAADAAEAEADRLESELDEFLADHPGIGAETLEVFAGRRSRIAAHRPDLAGLLEPTLERMTNRLEANQ